MFLAVSRCAANVGKDEECVISKNMSEINKHIAEEGCSSASDAVEVEVTTKRAFKTLFDMDSALPLLVISQAWFSFDWHADTWALAGLPCFISPINHTWLCVTMPCDELRSFDVALQSPQELFDNAHFANHLN